MIRTSYLDTFRYRDDVERDGLAMVVHSAHRPIEAYSRALKAADLLIVGSSRVDLQACKLEYSIVSPK